MNGVPHAPVEILLCFPPNFIYISDLLARGEYYHFLELTRPCILHKPPNFHMLKYLLLLQACIFATSPYAQKSKFTFKLGSEYELPRKAEDLAFFGNEKDGIVNLALKKEELIIVRFSPKTLRQTMEKQIELKEATRNFTSEIVADFNNNNYYWIHSDWEKDGGKEILYYDKIDVNTAKITDANHKMFESTKMAGSAIAKGFYNMKTVDKYKYAYDADRKKLLVTYRLEPEQRNDKKNYDKIGFQVFDDNMNKLWGNEFQMPYTEAIMDNSNFSIDSKGNAYMLAKVYDNDSRRERDKQTGKPAYRFEVFKFSKESKKISITPIALEGFYINETTLTENSLHDMIVACTYSKKAKGDGTDGIFLATLGADGKLEKYQNGYFEFPKEELEKFESARKRRRIDKKDDYEAPNIKVRDVVVETDGSIFVSCEEYRMTTRISQSPTDNRMRVTYTFYYDDMLGCKINAAGKFEWVRKIPKRQIGSHGIGTMSFKLISDASGYYFLYLDNVKNLKLAETEEPKLHADGFGGQVIVSKLAKDGTHTKELLFDTRDEDIMIFPSEFYRIDGNRFIGRARVKRNLFQPLLITTN